MAVWQPGTSWTKSRTFSAKRMRFSVLLLPGSSIGIEVELGPAAALGLVMDVPHQADDGLVRLGAERAGDVLLPGSAKPYSRFRQVYSKPITTGVLAPSVFQ